MAEQARWRISESIAGEVDAALSLTFSESFRHLVSSFSETLETLDQEWYEQGEEFFSGVAGGFFSILSRMTVPLGLTEQTDYSAVSMQLRETSAEELAEAALASAAEANLAVEAGDEPAETLARFYRAMRGPAGIDFVDGGEGPRYLRRVCNLICAIAHGGHHHASFWHWLDRYYYETYLPWRQTRQEFIDDAHKRALTALGAESGTGVPPLDWLPPQNPLTRAELLKESATSGNFDLVFWTEPFGLWGMIELVPDTLVVSYGASGELLDNFRHRPDEIATKLKAIADPTRLSILRIIRHVEVDNSEIADYLEVSHPTVSVHAKTLREAGLIQCRREGRRLLHRINPDAIRQLMRELESFLGLPLE